MPDVVVLCGHPRPRSRTSELALEVGRRFAATRADPSVRTVDVAELGPALLEPEHGATTRALLDVQDAALLIVATPACRGAYSGVLKVLLDQLPANALAGVLAVPVVTADVPAQAEVAEALLCRLLSELGADVIDFGLTATGRELSDPVALAGQYVAAFAA